MELLNDLHQQIVNYEEIEPNEQSGTSAYIMCSLGGKVYPSTPPKSATKEPRGKASSSLKLVTLLLEIITANSVWLTALNKRGCSASFQYRLLRRIFFT